MSRIGRIGSAASMALSVCLVVVVSAAWVAPSHSGTKRMFKDETYQELQGYAAIDRLVAVVRCEAIETLQPGSRSERQQIRATVLAGPATLAAGSAVLLARFAQGKPLMDVGKTYLVAAYRESTSGPLALVEHRAVDPAAAASDYEAARADLSARLDGLKSR